MRSYSRFRLIDGVVYAILLTSCVTKCTFGQTRFYVWRGNQGGRLARYEGVLAIFEGYA